MVLTQRERLQESFLSIRIESCPFGTHGSSMVLQTYSRQPYRFIFGNCQDTFSLQNIHNHAFHTIDWHFSLEPEYR